MCAVTSPVLLSSAPITAVSLDSWEQGAREDTMWTGQRNAETGRGRRVDVTHPRASTRRVRSCRSCASSGSSSSGAGGTLALTYGPASSFCAPKRFACDGGRLSCARSRGPAHVRRDPNHLQGDRRGRGDGFGGLAEEARTQRTLQCRADVRVHRHLIFKKRIWAGRGSTSDRPKKTGPGGEGP